MNFQTCVTESEDVVVDGNDLMEATEEDINVDEEASTPSPDPMAGIGYWESPGNSPERVIAEGVNDDPVEEGDLAHQRSRDDGIMVDLTCPHCPRVFRKQFGAERHIRECPNK